MLLFFKRRPFGNDELIKPIWQPAEVHLARRPALSYTVPSGSLDLFEIFRSRTRNYYLKCAFTSGSLASCSVSGLRHCAVYCSPVTGSQGRLKVFLKYRNLCVRARASGSFFGLLAVPWSSSVMRSAAQWWRGRGARDAFFVASK